MARLFMHHCTHPDYSSPLSPSHESRMSSTLPERDVQFQKYFTIMAPKYHHLTGWTTKMIAEKAIASGESFFDDPISGTKNDI